jgi:hypothetical protein
VDLLFTAQPRIVVDCRWSSSGGWQANVGAWPQRMAISPRCIPLDGATSAGELDPSLRERYFPAVVGHGEPEARELRSLR